MFSSYFLEEQRNTDSGRSGSGTLEFRLGWWDVIASDYIETRLYAALSDNANGLFVGRRLLDWRRGPGFGLSGQERIGIESTSGWL